MVHRDIKVDNCLISDHGIAKLGDFGLAHILPSPTSSDQLFKGMGSRKYRAPEVVQDRSGSTGFSGFQADVRRIAQIFCLAITNGHTLLAFLYRPYASSALCASSTSYRSDRPTAAVFPADQDRTAARLNIASSREA